MDNLWTIYEYGWWFGIPTPLKKIRVSSSIGMINDSINPNCFCKNKVHVPVTTNQQTPFFVAENHSLPPAKPRKNLLQTTQSPSKTKAPSPGTKVLRFKPWRPTWRRSVDMTRWGNDRSSIHDMYVHMITVCVCMCMYVYIYIYIYT